MDELKEYYPTCYTEFLPITLNDAREFFPKCPEWVKDKQLFTKVACKGEVMDLLHWDTYSKVLVYITSFKL